MGLNTTICRRPIDDEVVISKAERGGPINRYRSAYQGVKVKIDAIVLFAAIDGAEPGERFEFVKNEIAAAFEFSKVERARLLAYAFASRASLPKLWSKMRAGCRNTAPNSEASAGLGSCEAEPLAFAEILFEK